MFLAHTHWYNHMGKTIPVPIINNAESMNSIIFPPDNMCVKIAFSPPIIQVWKR